MNTSAFSIQHLAFSPKSYPNADRAGALPAEPASSKLPRAAAPSAQDTQIKAAGRVCAFARPAFVINKKTLRSARRQLRAALLTR